MILDMLCDDRRLDRSRVLVDHVEEHTIRPVLDEGFWAGMTLYPVSKCTPAAGRATWSRCTAPSGCWSTRPATGAPRSRPPCPTSSWRCVAAATPRALIRRVVYENPLEFFSQSRNFDFTPPENEGLGIGDWGPGVGRRTV